MGVVTSGWNGMEQNMTPLFKKKKDIYSFCSLHVNAIHSCMLQSSLCLNQYTRFKFYEYSKTL